MEKKKRYRRAFVSAYVYTTIRQRIEGGKYSVDSILPSENELCDECGASRMTIRGALKRLATDGFIKSIPGKGWIVIRSSVIQNFNHLNPILLIGSLFYKESIFLSSLVNQLNSLGLSATPGLPMKEVEHYFSPNRPCPWSAVIAQSGAPLSVELVSACHRAHVPLIGIMVCDAQEKYDTIVNDHELEVKELLTFMVEGGVKNIAYLSPKDLENGPDPSFKTQNKSFKEFMRDYTKSPQQFICKSNYGLDDVEGEQFLDWITKADPPIDAIYCTTPYMVELALHKLMRVGEKISSSIKICGARIIVHPAQLRQHGLTHLWSVEADHEALVKAVVQTLTLRIRDDRSLPRHIIVPPRIYRITDLMGPRL